MTILSQMNEGQRAEFDAAGGKARSILSFAVVPNVMTDQSARINSAIDSGEALFFPPGDYYVGDSILLATNTKIEGAGPRRAMFRALSGGTAPMIAIRSGQVRYVTVRDIGLQGDTSNTSQHGLFVRGVGGTGGNGGLWDSTFDNIRIRGIRGASIALLGATVLDNTIPAQFLLFNRIDAERPTADAGPCLYAHGQVEHVDFSGSCRLHGPASSGAQYGGTNVYLGRAFGASGDVVGPLGTGTALSAVAPRVFGFWNTSNENADTGYLLDAVQGVMLGSGWFEQIKENAIKAQNSCRAVVSLNQRFADAALNSTGKAVRSNSNSHVVVYDPRFEGTNTVALSNDGSGSVLAKGSGTGGLALENLLWDRTLSNAGSAQSIDCGVNPGLFLGASASGVQISAITSPLAVGELFTLKVKTTSSFPITLVTGSGGISNFNLGKDVTSLIINPGETAHLRRSQTGQGWDLVAKL